MDFYDLLFLKYCLYHDRRYPQSLSGSEIIYKIICNVSNFPTSHSDPGRALQYLVESDYLAITEHHMLQIILLEIDIIACIGTKGMFCWLFTTLYMLDKNYLYIVVLYMRDKQKTEKNW